MHSPDLCWTNDHLVYGLNGFQSLQANARTVSYIKPKLHPFQFTVNYYLINCRYLARETNSVLEAKEAVLSLTNFYTTKTYENNSAPAGSLNKIKNEDKKQTPWP
jgi:hypothetical protein